MKVFLIILAVLVLLFAFILSLSAELTVVYDNGWHTSVQVLFIKKDIELSKILNFILFPDKAGKQAAEKKKEKRKIILKSQNLLKKLKQKQRLNLLLRLKQKKMPKQLKNPKQKQLKLMHQNQKQNLKRILLQKLLMRTA